MSRSKLHLGLVLSLEKSFTKSDVLLFSKLSGDYNKIHIDDEYAITTRFKSCICHGMLVGSLFTNLIGNNFPSSIYINQSLNFKSPVYIDELVKAEIEVESIVKKIIVLKTTVIKPNYNNLIAIDGKATVLLDNIDEYIKL
jgi:3-hydroxybutyryl-CoA dehydratase